MNAPDSSTPLHRHAAPRRELARRYRYYVRSREFRKSLIASLALFFASTVVSFYAIRYATARASSPVDDIFLSNTTAIEVDGTFAIATILLIVFIALILLAHPKRIPFALKSLAIFFFIRSAFITLTHIGPFPVQPPDSSWGALLNHFLFSSDLFFSAHTGAPFLMALMFWQERNIRNVFLVWSVFLAAVVLLGHLHYSIDVASAYFITYSIFCIAVWMFPKDRGLFLSDVPEHAS